MGWIKVPEMTSKQIFDSVVASIGDWRGVPKGNTSAYEFFADYLRDYYPITLTQCGEVCKMLRDYYNIEHFYYGE